MPISTQKEDPIKVNETHVNIKGHQEFADKFHLIKNLSDAIFIEVKNMFDRIRKIAKNYINSSYVDINDIEAVEDVVMIKDDNHKYQTELDKRKTRFELFYNLKNKGLNKDWEAICNAVKYKLTNSLVEGCVNRLKI